MRRKSYGRKSLDGRDFRRIAIAGPISRPVDRAMVKVHGVAAGAEKVSQKYVPNMRPAVSSNAGVGTRVEDPAGCLGMNGRDAGESRPTALHLHDSRAEIRVALALVPWLPDPLPAAALVNEHSTRSTIFLRHDRRGPTGAGI